MSLRPLLLLWNWTSTLSQFNIIEFSLSLTLSNFQQIKSLSLTNNKLFLPRWWQLLHSVSSQRTVLGAPYVTPIQHTFISTAGSYRLEIHITCCIFDNFPLFGSSSTPNSAHIQCTLHIMDCNSILHSLSQSYNSVTTSLAYTTPINSITTLFFLHVQSLKGCECNKQPAITPPSPMTRSIIWGAFSIITDAVRDMPCHALIVNTIAARFTHLWASSLKKSHNHSTGSLGLASTQGNSQCIPKAFQMMHLFWTTAQCHLQLHSHPKFPWLSNSRTSIA